MSIPLTPAEKRAERTKFVVGSVVALVLAAAAVAGGLTISDSQKRSEAKLAVNTALIQIAEVEPVTVVQLSAGNPIGDEYAALGRIADQLDAAVLPTDLDGKQASTDFAGRVTQLSVTSPPLRDGKWLTYPYGDLSEGTDAGADALPEQVLKLLPLDAAGKAASMDAYSTHDLIGLAKRAEKIARFASASTGNSVIGNDAPIGDYTTEALDAVQASVDGIDQIFAAYPNATPEKQAALRDAAVVLSKTLNEDTYLIGDIASPNAPSKSLYSPITLESVTADYFAALAALRE